MKELTIAMPAYNEGETLPSYIPEVISFCHKHDWELVIVNDGSKDNSKEFLESLVGTEGYTFVNHKVNRGYGGALKSGIRASKTKYTVTIDADGQHYLEDVEMLLQEIKATDADMIVGSRKGHKNASWYRGLGKSIIRRIARFLVPNDIYDINSGMKIYDTKLAQKHIQLCPDSMSFSDVILLTFISQRHLVLERPIRIKERLAGESTINALTALETVKEIFNIVLLFNPMKIFLPLAFFFLAVGVIWGTPIVLRGGGVSSGALLSILSGLIFFFLGLLTEQISILRRMSVSDEAS